MSDFTIYEDSRKAINNLISDKEEQIKNLQNEIFYLKKTKTMMDEEQFNKIQNPEKGDM